MRTVLLIAAIAASAIATSFTAADAATLKHHEMSKARVEHVAPTSYYGQEFGESVIPLPQAVWFSNADPRLSQIESQLDQADRAINADQRRGKLTVSEAQNSSEADMLIRNAAFDAIRQNHGSIPDSSYSLLLGRVAGLDQSVQMDTQRG